jgi:hypothetical protein
VDGNVGVLSEPGRGSVHDKPTRTAGSTGTENQRRGSSGSTLAEAARNEARGVKLPDHLPLIACRS